MHGKMPITQPGLTRRWHSGGQTSSRSNGAQLRLRPDEDSAADQRHQSNLDGLRFAPALTRLIPGPDKAFYENAT